MRYIFLKSILIISLLVYAYPVNANTSITEVTPNEGDVSGGNKIQIEGEGFTDVKAWNYEAQGYQKSGIICISNNSDIYTAGSFSGIVSFDGVPVTGSGSNDMYIKKYTSDGQLIWYKTFGDVGYDDIKYIDCYNNDIYITGQYSGTINWGNSIFTSSVGGSDAFVARFNADGDPLWVNSLGGPSHDHLQSVKADQYGVYALGANQSSFNIGSDTLSYVGGNDTFVTKMDHDGNYIWSKSVINGPGGGELARSIDTDQNGDIYLVSFYRIGATLDQTISLNNQGSADFIAAKYNGNTGQLIWHNTVEGHADQAPNGIIVDSSGNMYVTGYITLSADFDGESVSSIGGREIFLVKYDTDGNQEWVRRAGSTFSDVGKNLALDGNEDILLTGSFSDVADFNDTLLSSEGANDIFVAKYSKSGDVLSVRSGGSSTTGAGGGFGDIGNSVEYDPNTGDIYVLGTFLGSMNFYENELTDTGAPRDTVIIKFSDINVSIGGEECTEVNYISDAEIECTVPPNHAGEYEITVNNTNGTSFTGSSYTYTKRLELSDDESVDPVEFANANPVNVTAPENQLIDSSSKALNMLLLGGLFVTCGVIIPMFRKKLRHFI